MKNYLKTSLLVSFLSVNLMAQAELSVLTNIVGGKTADEQALFEKTLEEKLGFEIDMRKPSSGYDQVMMTTLASGEAIDVLYLTGKHLPLLVDKGGLMDLTSIIQESIILSDKRKIPQKEWDLIKYNNGLYAVPAKFEGGTMPILRKDWLEEFDMKIPVTLDDWYLFFQKAKEEKDAYGLSFKGKELYDIQGFMSAANVKAGYVIDENGKRTIPYATEAAAPIYDWFAKLYKEGLLDPNFITNETSDMRKMFLTNQAATVTYWDMWVGLFNNIKHNENPDDPFEAMGVAGVADENGHIILRRGDASLWTIPKSAKNKEQAIKFLEFWHTDEGYLLGTLGIEGHDYNIVDNQYVLTKLGKEHNLDHGTPRVTSLDWESPFPLPKGVKEAQDIISQYASPEFYPQEWPKAFGIVEKYALQAMRGDMSGKEAVKKMRKELLKAKLIDQ